MNLFWSRILLRKTDKSSIELSKYRQAKMYREFWLVLRRNVKDTILIVVGIFSAAFGLKGFLLQSGFIDGGVTGISLLTSVLTEWPLAILIIVINIPFVFLGMKVLGKRFAIKTAIAIAGLSLCLALITFPEVTNDKVLVAIFGGFFLGAGIGLSIRGGAVIDGTEVLAIYLSRKIGVTIGDVIVGINVVIFSVAAYFLSVEIALYSIVTYLAASKTLDFVVEGIEEYIGVTIVSTHYDEIRQMIIEVMGRGVTVYSGKRGYGVHGSRKEVDILYSVVTRLELNKLNIEIEKIDPNAFVVMNSVKDTKGGMIKKRPFKH